MGTEEKPRAVSWKRGGSREGPVLSVLFLMPQSPSSAPISSLAGIVVCRPDGHTASSFSSLIYFAQNLVLRMVLPFFTCTSSSEDLCLGFHRAREAQNLMLFMPPKLHNVPSIVTWIFLCGILQYGGQLSSEFTMPLGKPDRYMKQSPGFRQSGLLAVFYHAMGQIILMFLTEFLMDICPMECRLALNLIASCVSTECQDYRLAPPHQPLLIFKNKHWSWECGHKLLISAL